MFRCTMPVFTCILEFLIHGTTRSLGVYLSLIPVIFGTMLVCKGDVRTFVRNYLKVHGSLFGILLLVVSCTISSLKGIITKYLLSGKEPVSTFQLLNCVCFEYIFKLECSLLCRGVAPLFNHQRQWVLLQLDLLVLFEFLYSLVLPGPAFWFSLSTVSLPSS